MAVNSRWAEALQRAWWQPRPGLLALSLWPLSMLYRALASLSRWRWRLWPASALPVPVLVVGNLVVGGAGKTPTVIALVQSLQAAGRRPGIISRGYGRAGTGVLAVSADSSAADTGDEPLLIHRRTGAPTFVGRDRLAAAQALLAAHPEVDMLVADDGLQHARLRRDLQVLVFDRRGIGNGLCLPAGPLRQPATRQVPARSLVLYNAERPSMAWPGAVASRAITRALPWAAWHAGAPGTPQALAELVRQSRHRPLLAMAGLAEPERFFDMLRALDLHIQTQALPDHASFRPLPWPAGTPDVLLTEKDAVKLQPSDVGATRVWVLPLDFALPADFQRQLLDALASISNPLEP